MAVATLTLLRITIDLLHCLHRWYLPMRPLSKYQGGWGRNTLTSTGHRTSSGASCDHCSGAQIFFYTEACSEMPTYISHPQTTYPNSKSLPATRWGHVCLSGYLSFEAKWTALHSANWEDFLSHCLSFWVGDQNALAIEFQQAPENLQSCWVQ